MKTTQRLLALTGKLAEKFATYSVYSPTPVSLKQLTAFGENASQSLSYKFLRYEVPVRLANIMQEIHLLPENLLKTPSVRLVLSLYEQSFADLIRFENAREDDYAVLTEFTDNLARIRNRHTNVVDTMAQGVMEMKERYGTDLSTDNQLQYFLDRFYMSRISIRMVINQHVLLFGPELNSDRRFIGSIDVKCNVAEVIRDAYENARFLCEQYYMCSPPLDLDVVTKDDGPDRLEMVYVPSHLYHILFEIMKNSMRAVVELDEDSVGSRPIHVRLCKGSEDVTIQISDLGGGIPRSLMDLVFKYTYTTATQPAMHPEGGHAPLAGYGYGLPLSRLYAKYFNGDLHLNSIEGYGTTATIFLKQRAADADELLPVFNHTSARQYTHAGIPVGDWSNPTHTTGLHISYPARNGHHSHHGHHGHHGHHVANRGNGGSS